MLFHEEKMCAEDMELILNYRKYKLVFFFGDKQQLLREFKLCKLRLTSVRIFIKPYSLELKVIYQLVSTKTNRLLVFVFKESKSQLNS